MSKEVKSIEPEQTPEWLEAAFSVQADFRKFEPGSELHKCPPGFLAKCHAAGEIAYALTRLGHAQARIGFQPSPPQDYLHDLARAAGVALHPVMQHLGMSDLREITPQSATAFARLARRLGLAARETVIHVRIGFLANLDPAQLPMLMAVRRSRDGQSSTLSDCEDLLVEAESELSVDVLRRLNHAVTAVEAVFRRPLLAE